MRFFAFLAAVVVGNLLIHAAFRYRYIISISSTSVCFHSLMNKPLYLLRFLVFLYTFIIPFCFGFAEAYLINATFIALGLSSVVFSLSFVMKNSIEGEYNFFYDGIEIDIRNGWIVGLGDDYAVIVSDKSHVPPYTVIPRPQMDRVMQILESFLIKPTTKRFDQIYRGGQTDGIDHVVSDFFWPNSPSLRAGDFF